MSLAATSHELYGSGIDGDITIASDDTLTRDMYYESLTVNAGKSLSTGGYKIYVRNSLTVHGTIRNNGTDGSNASVTTGGAGGTSTGATVGAGSAGTAGPSGSGSGGPGSQATAPTATVGEGGNGGGGGERR